MVCYCGTAMGCPEHPHGLPERTPGGMHPELDELTEGMAEQTRAFLAAAAEWSNRLDGFCEELERRGLAVERDGFTVTIRTAPQKEGSE